MGRVYSRTVRNDTAKRKKKNPIRLLRFGFLFEIGSTVMPAGGGFMNPSSRGEMPWGAGTSRSVGGSVPQRPFLGLPGFTCIGSINRILRIAHGRVLSYHTIITDPTSAFNPLHARRICCTFETVVAGASFSNFSAFSAAAGSSHRSLIRG
jgi:hypothetical protein